MRTNKEVLEKIGQLQYEISILDIDEEKLTGVTIRTEELKEIFNVTDIDDDIDFYCYEKHDEKLPQCPKQCIVCRIK